MPTFMNHVCHVQEHGGKSILTVMKLKDKSYWVPVSVSQAPNGNSWRYTIHKAKLVGPFRSLCIIWKWDYTSIEYCITGVPSLWGSVTELLGINHSASSGRPETTILPRRNTHAAHAVTVLSIPSDCHTILVVNYSQSIVYHDHNLPRHKW